MSNTLTRTSFSHDVVAIRRRTRLSCRVVRAHLLSSARSDQDLRTVARPSKSDIGQRFTIISISSGTDNARSCAEFLKLRCGS